MTDTERRRACVLLPLFSIRTPSGWGLGEIPDIPRFARWAGSAGFSVLQLLPVGAVCGGETSPYAAASAFALDPVYLGLDDCEDFLAAGGRTELPAEDRARIEELARSATVSWSAARALKDRATARAFAHFLEHEWSRGSARARQLEQFRELMTAWLDDYALFAVLHERFAKSWQDWPAPLRDRAPEALAAARQEHAQAILLQTWLQWQLDLQWRAARAEASEAGVALMGDLPFQVSADSADVWARRECFRLDLRVGTPPDAFSVEGQDWGLPAYDWDAMGRADFAWMRARATRVGELYGLYRVDHVIGLYRTFTRSPEGQTAFLPPDEPAQIQLGETVLRILGEAGEVVAEDLGAVPPFLRPSLERLGVPGYKVLRWERDEVTGGRDEPAVIRFRDPADWPVVSVAASATHDVETNAEWFDHLSSKERDALARLPGLEALASRRQFDAHVRDALLRTLYAAPSALAAVLLQDALGTRERINVPGTVADSNWVFRMPRDVAELVRDAETTSRLARLAAEAGRAPSRGGGGSHT